MFTKKFFLDNKFPIFAFLVWRILIFIPVFIASFIFPLQKNFLGGGLQNYLNAPWFWTWANFDGEHYISIAQNGYGIGEQAFFPLYPLLIKSVTQLFNLSAQAGNSITTYTVVGIFISNLSFLIALIGLYKLMKLDYSEKATKLSLLLLLLFPTSFYFGSVYTESLFLALVIWSFYLARKQKWLFAGILGMFASATRFIGILIFPVLLIELFINHKSKLIYLFLVPLGLITYMLYLDKASGDPLAFIHTLSGFGEQRSKVPIVLPQVFYRYVFKILPNLNYSYFPLLFTTFLEFSVALIFTIVSTVGFFKIRLSYALYLALGFLIPTLAGSFSSLPRYVLVLFPAFIILAIFLRKKSKIFKFLVFSIMLIFLVVSAALFVRGYWIS